LTTGFALATLYESNNLLLPLITVCSNVFAKKAKDSSSKD
jgi:hypothetical protein